MKRTCRDAVLDALERLESRHGRRTFLLKDLVDEVLSAGEPFLESTVRTHITSRMCANSPDHHAVTYEDLERVGRGQYRRSRAAVADAQVTQQCHKCGAEIDAQISFCTECGEQIRHTECPTERSWVSWYLHAWSNYFNFADRAPRIELCTFFLTNSAILLAASLSGNSVLSVLAAIFVVIHLVPMIAVQVRRFHDRNQSAWWLLTSIIPLIYFIVLLFQLFASGTQGENKYGPDPRYE